MSVSSAEGLPRKYLLLICNLLVWLPLQNFEENKMAEEKKTAAGS